MAQSIWYRSGAAYANWAPLGASVDIARSTKDAKQSAALGRGFAAADGRKPLYLNSQYAAMNAKSKGGSDKNELNAASTAQRVNADPVIKAVGWLGRALNAPVEASSRLAQTAIRGGARTASAYKRGGLADGFDEFRDTSLFGGVINILNNPEARDDWEQVVNSRASLGQSFERVLAAGTYGKGEVAPDAPFSLLDDPERSAERRTFYENANMRFTVGLFDMAYVLFADPLVIGGKAASVARKGAAKLTARDAASVADRSLELGQLSGKQRQARKLIDTMVDEMDSTIMEPGAVAAWSRTKYLGQATDNSVIPLLMRDIHSMPEFALDDVARKTAMRDVMQAGMGDVESMARLGKASPLLKVQLDNVMSDVAREHPIFKVLDAGRENMDRALGEIQKDPKWLAEVAAQRKQIENAIEHIDRLKIVGSPTGTMARGARNRGELAILPLGSGPGDILKGRTSVTSLASRDVAHVAKTIHAGRFTEPLHVLTGRHLPSAFYTSATDSPEVFHTALIQGSKAGMDKDLLRALDDEFVAAIPEAGAATRVGRGEAVRKFNVAFDAHLAKKYGVDPEQVKGMMNDVRANRMSEMNLIVSHAMKAQPGDNVTLRMGDGTAFVLDPTLVKSLREQADLDSRLLMPGQTGDLVSIVDAAAIDKFVGRYVRRGYGDANNVSLAGFLKQGETGWNIVESGLTSLNHLWKFSALFRLGYPLRVQMDTQARMLSQLGTARYFTNVIRSSGNMAYNLSKVDGAFAEQMSRKIAANNSIHQADMRLSQFGKDEQIMGDQVVVEFRDRMGDFHASPPMSLRDARAFAGMEKSQFGASISYIKQPAMSPLQREVWQESTALKAQIADARKILDEAPVKSGVKVRVRGTDMAKHLGGTVRSDKSGKIIDHWDPTAAFNSEAERLRMMGKFNADKNTIGLWTDDVGDTLSNDRSSGAWDLFAGTRPEWEGHYLRHVNQQIRNNSGAAKILAGATDREMVTWLRTTEGRAYWRNLKPAWEDIERNYGVDSQEVWLGQLREDIDLVLPTPEMQAAALGRNITSADVKALWNSPSDRPKIPGELRSLMKDKPAHVQVYERTAKKFFHVAAEMPENMMGRHPFYIERQSAYMQQLISDAGRGKKTFSPGELGVLKRKADVLARRDIGKIMFDTSKQDNIGYHLRFMSPFYSAWKDMFEKWGHIAGTDFATVPMIAKVFRAPNAAGLITDDEGRKVDANGDVMEDGKVVGHVDPLVGGNLVLPLPGFIKEATGAKDMMIRKEALNVPWQGQPFFLPGAGPLATIPISEIMFNMFPEQGPGFSDSAVGQYLQGGMGPSKSSNPGARIADKMVPAWMKKGWDAAAMPNLTGTATSGNAVNAYTQEYLTLVTEIQNGDRAEMSFKELDKLATNRARGQMILRFIGAEMVVTANPRGRLQFYVDKYRAFQQTYGLEAYDKFVEEYPEYANMTISLTQNETGIQATEEAYRSALPYAKTIDKNPEYGWFFAGEQNMLGEFSEGVYTKQYQQGDRTPKTAIERINDVQTRKGWSEYVAYNGELRDALTARGLRSFSSEDAADLSLLRDQFVTALQADNPAWAEAYHSREAGDSAAKFLSFAVQAVTDNEELGDRGDIQALSAYIEGRNQMMQLMADEGIGSLRNAQGQVTEGAEDFASTWDAFTQSLVDWDLGFEYMWDRTLESDRLSTETW